MPRQPWVDIHRSPRQIVRAYEIADSYVAAMIRAWLKWTRDLGELIEEPVGDAIDEAYSADAAVRAHDVAGEQAYSDLKGRYAKITLALWEESADEADKVFDRVFAVELRGAAKQIKPEPIAWVGSVPVLPGDYVDLDRLAAAATYVQREGTRLVAKDVLQPQRDSIRKQVQHGIDTGKHPRVIARKIRSQVGILPGPKGPYTQDMVTRFWTQQVEAGLSGKNLDAAVARYERKLIKRRAENIARTEMMAAEAQSQRDTWRGRAGRLGFAAEREWVADGKACPICALLDGARAPLNGRYSDGSDGPIAHPSCRCTEALHPLRPK